MRSLKNFACKHYQLLYAALMFVMCLYYWTDESLSAAEAVGFNSPLIDYGFGLIFGVFSFLIFFDWLFDLVASKRSKKKEVTGDE